MGRAMTATRATPGAMKRRLLPASLGLAAVLGFASLAGVGACRSEPGVSGCPSAEPQGTPIDARVMAFLSAARALHHEADMHERSGDARGALSPLERLIALPTPAAVEVDEVLADTHARLAELRLGLGRPRGRRPRRPGRVASRARVDLLPGPPARGRRTDRGGACRGSGRRRPRGRRRRRADEGHGPSRRGGPRPAAGHRARAARHGRRMT